MIYVPNDSTFKVCPYINNANTLRVYDRQPSNNTTANYRDYYFNSHYLYTQGQQTWNQYSQLPTCLSSSEVTSNVFYRNDLDQILICFIIIVIFCFYFPYRIISRLFGRWFKL